ncbi:MAG: hypothetical protein PF961_08885 [Planctomycetota bacterium]|jgi:hypothetical protein|nr:hypothetical protein [Planctomycetota bacterium]
MQTHLLDSQQTAVTLPAEPSPALAERITDFVNKRTERGNLLSQLEDALNTVDTTVRDRGFVVDSTAEHLRVNITDVIKNLWHQLRYDLIAEANTTFAPSGTTLGVGTHTDAFPGDANMPLIVEPMRLWAWFVANYGGTRGHDHVYRRDAHNMACLIRLRDRGRWDKEEPIFAYKDGSIRFFLRASVDSYDSNPRTYAHNYRGEAIWHKLAQYGTAFCAWARAQGRASVAEAFTAATDRAVKIGTTGHGGAIVWNVAQTCPGGCVITPRKNKILIKLPQPVGAALSEWFGTYLPPEEDDD